MKKINISILSLLITIALGLTSCITIKSLPNGKAIDKRLVGAWTGSETGQQTKGVYKEWEMTRNEDGTYVVHFKTKTIAKTREFTEKGTWWVEKNKIFEHCSGPNKADAFKFVVINKNKIKLELLSTGLNVENPNYTVIEKRKNSLTPTKINTWESIND